MKIMFSKALVFAVIVLFVGAGVVPSMSSDNSSFGNTIYVDDDGGADFIHIQNAIDAARNGDTIYVYGGTYVENLLVDKSVTLTGEDKELTIIDGGGVGDVILVSADDVMIHSFTIRNSGDDSDGISTWGPSGYEKRLEISDNIFYDISDIAIRFSRTSESNIYNNDIYNCGGGIQLASSSDSNIVDGNILSNIDQDFGIHLTRSEKNIISNNIVTSSYAGIVMTAPGEFTNNNKVVNNQVINCYAGVSIQYANNNQFYGNLFQNNDYGLLINNDCTNNEIFHNSFVANNQHSSDGQINLWYNNSLQEGNFWDDYSGSDGNGDGIGDTPYDIPGEGDNQDVFPLMMPVHNVAPSAPNVFGPSSGKAGEEQMYSACSNDLNDDDVFYFIDWGDGETEEWIGPFGSSEEQSFSHTWDEQGEYTIRVRAKDDSGLMSDWTFLPVSMPKNKQYMPLGIILAFGFDVDVKIVQLEPGEDYVDLEVLSKPFYIWENEIQTINSGAFIRLYFAKGFFSPSVPICFGICEDWSLIG